MTVNPYRKNKVRRKYSRQYSFKRNSKSLPRAIEPNDVKKLIRTIKMPRDRAMFLLMLRTGMRIGEMLRSKLSDINLKEQKVLIYESLKNNEGRVVYFCNDAKTALKKWIKERDPQKFFLFYSQGNNKFSYGGANMMFKKYLEKAGLSQKKYTLHCVRHTFASELLNAGMSLESLQKLLGHSDIETTRRYARLTDKTLESEYFKAMSIIERGGIYGSYRFDS